MKITNTRNLPDVLVEAVKADPYTKGAADCSVTELLKPPRQAALQRQYKEQITEDVSGLVFSLYGQIMHSILDRAGKSVKDVITEERLFMDAGGWTISGSFDLMTMDKSSRDGYHLMDYKFVTGWSFAYGKVKPEYTQQLNLYAELLRRHGFPVTKLSLISLYRDFSKGTARKNPNYPQAQAEVHEIELWSPEVTNAFLEERIRLHQQAEIELPFCNREERWMNPRQPEWALIKTGGVRPSKIYKSEQEALENKQTNQYIEYRGGIAIRCEDYCSVAEFCTQYQETKNNGN